MGGAKWSPHDEQVLLDHYETEGSRGCAARLGKPRSAQCIQQAARRMGLRHNGEYRAQVLTPQLERELKHAYTIGERGRLKRLAYKHGVNMGWLKQQAAQLGLVKSRKRHDWPPAADDIVRESEGLGPKQTQRYLARAGFEYPLSVVAGRIGTLGVSAERDDGMTANDVAKLLDVDHHMVARWIRTGALKTRKRDNAKGEAYQKHWLTHRAVRDFLITYQTEWDMRRVKPAYQPLLVDLLTG